MITVSDEYLDDDDQNHYYTWESDTPHHADHDERDYNQSNYYMSYHDLSYDIDYNEPSGPVTRTGKKCISSGESNPREMKAEDSVRERAAGERLGEEKPRERSSQGGSTPDISRGGFLHKVPMDTHNDSMKSSSKVYDGDWASISRMSGEISPPRPILVDPVHSQEEFAPSISRLSCSSPGSNRVGEYILTNDDIMIHVRNDHCEDAGSKNPEDSFKNAENNMAPVEYEHLRSALPNTSDASSKLDTFDSNYQTNHPEQNDQRTKVNVEWQPYVHHLDASLDSSKDNSTEHTKFLGSLFQPPDDKRLHLPYRPRSLESGTGTKGKTGISNCLGQFPCNTSVDGNVDRPAMLNHQDNEIHPSVLRCQAAVQTASETGQAKKSIDSPEMEPLPSNPKFLAIGSQFDSVEEYSDESSLSEDSDLLSNVDTTEYDISLDGAEPLGSYFNVLLEKLVWGFRSVAGYQSSPNQNGSQHARKTAASGSNTTNGSSKQHLKRNAPHNDAGDDDDDGGQDGLPKRPRKEAERSQGGKERKYFACPFLKFDQTSYKKCCTKKLSRIQDVKQHLARCHTPERYCQRCQKKDFDDDASLQKHIAAAKCSYNDATMLEGITYEQRRELNRKSKPSLGESGQWFAIWEILFSGHERPESVYNEESSSLENHPFSEYCHNTGFDFLEEYAKSRPDWFERGSTKEQQQTFITRTRQAIQVLLEWHSNSTHSSDISEDRRTSYSGISSGGTDPTQFATPPNMMTDNDASPGSQISPRETISCNDIPVPSLSMVEPVYQVPIAYYQVPYLTDAENALGFFDVPNSIDHPFYEFRPSQIDDYYAPDPHWELDQILFSDFRGSVNTNREGN